MVMPSYRTWDGKIQHFQSHVRKLILAHGGLLALSHREKTASDVLIHAFKELYLDGEVSKNKWVSYRKLKKAIVKVKWGVITQDPVVKEQIAEYNKIIELFEAGKIKKVPQVPWRARIRDGAVINGIFKHPDFYIVNSMISKGKHRIFKLYKLTTFGQHYIKTYLIDPEEEAEVDEAEEALHG